RLPRAVVRLPGMYEVALGAYRNDFQKLFLRIPQRQDVRARFRDLRASDCKGSFPAPVVLLPYDVDGPGTVHGEHFELLVERLPDCRDIRSWIRKTRTREIERRRP